MRQTKSGNKTVFKAIFQDVDYPKNCDFEDYFNSLDKAKAFLKKKAKDYDIDNINWEQSGDGPYFNYQFEDHPSQDNACYHGAITEIEVK